MSTIAELAEDRVVEGVYAVARKRRLRTKSGSAYLALELVDPTGRIEGRVWNDVELLDARFGEGDAVRVLGRVERYRDRLQLDVRSIEAEPDEDPAGLRPGDAPRPRRARRVPRVPRRRDLARRAARDRRRILGDGEIRRRLRALPAAPDGHHVYAGGLLEHTVGVATVCRELCQLHPRLRADLLLSAALLHDVGRTVELEPGPGFRQTAEGRLLGHVHLARG